MDFDNPSLIPQSRWLRAHLSYSHFPISFLSFSFLFYNRFQSFSHSVSSFSSHQRKTSKKGKEKPPRTVSRVLYLYDIYTYAYGYVSKADDGQQMSISSRKVHTYIHTYLHTYMHTQNRILSVTGYLFRFGLIINYYSRIMRELIFLLCCVHKPVTICGYESK